MRSNLSRDQRHCRIQIRNQFGRDGHAHLAHLGQHAQRDHLWNQVSALKTCNGQLS